MTDLPPLEFALTDDDRAKAEQARAHLERIRRERNREDGSHPFGFLRDEDTP